MTGTSSSFASGLVVERPIVGVIELRLNRPERRNALTTALLADLYAELVAVGEDRSVRVVVLTGAGPTFCAGADLAEFEGHDPVDPADSLARVRLVGRVVRALTELEVVTISAVQGAAVGAGWGLAMACSLSWCADETVLGLPEVAKGLRLPRAIMNRLIQIVGPIRAAEIVFGGTVVDVDSAMGLGLVTRRFADAETLHRETLAFAQALAGRPLAVLRGATDPLRAAVAQGVAPEIEYQWPER